LLFWQIRREGKTAKATLSESLRGMLIKKEKMTGFSGTNLIMDAMTEKFVRQEPPKPRGHWLFAIQWQKRRKN